MTVKLKTQYSVDEVSTILNNKLLKNWKSQWSNNVYIGRISNNRFRYFYRKAYTKNSFSKEIIGRVYEHNGDTCIEARFISGLLRIKTFVYIWIITACLIFINDIFLGVRDSLLITLSAISIMGALFTLFILLPGIIITALPTNKANRERLIDFLKDNIAAEELCG